MQMKDVGFVQRHIEKLLIAIALLALLASIWLYGISAPHKADIGGEQVAPREIDLNIKEEADKLDAVVTNKTLPSVLQDIPDLDVKREFQIVRQGRMLSDNVTTQVALGDRPFLKEDVVPPTAQPFYEPKPQAPVLLAQRSALTTIDEKEIQKAPQPWTQVLPAAGPYDLAYVSLTGQFDMGAFESEELLKRPPNLPANVREIPISWWKDKLGIFGVQLERQELQADGSWSEPTLVDVMPNQEFSAGLIYKNERAEGDALRQIEIQDANNLLNYQKDNWEALVQPPFPQVVGEQQWVPPGEEIPAAEDPAEAPRTQPAPRRTAPAPRRPAPRPRGELTPEEERELAERRSGRTPGTRPTRPVPTRPQPETTERRRPPAVGGRLGVAKGEILNPPLEGDAVYTLWASDLTVQPGKTYRYRMRLFVNNPLFRKPELPQGPPSQQAKKFGKLFLVASDWSGWGKPVKIKPLIDFNVIAAAQTPKPGQASTVVKRFYYGQWREEKFRPRPGEPIGGPKEILIDALGQKRVVDFSTGAYLVHIDFAHLVADNFGTPRREIQVLYFNGGGQAAARRIDQDKKAYEQWKQEHQAVPAAPDAN